MLWEKPMRRGDEMRPRRRILTIAAGLLLALGISGAASAQKQGGTLRVYHRDSPASMSIHEEATWSTIMPMMGVFNNLVLYDQHMKQNSLATVRPELATSWSRNEDGTELTFKLRRDVKWHDGKPFTAADVKLHLGSAARPRQGEAEAQPARDLVSEPRRCHDEGRGGSDLPHEAAAARLSRIARVGGLAGLSLSRVAARYAHAPDRHRSVQICRLQAEPIPQSRAQPVLLETGAAL